MSRVLVGLDVRPARIEVVSTSDASPLLVCLNAVLSARGMETTVRLRGALGSLGTSLGSGLRVEVTAPRVAHVASLDLAIFAAILSHLGLQFHRATDYFGELDVAGAVRPTRGALLLAEAADGDAVIPTASLAEVAPFVGGWHLSRAAQLLGELGRVERTSVQAQEGDLSAFANPALGTLSEEIRSRMRAGERPRVLLVANPGEGVTALARSLCSGLSIDHAREVTRVYSAAGLGRGAIGLMPLRAPHHSVSLAGMVGGGSGAVYLGEVTLAHRGVLLLDDVLEFRQAVIAATLHALAARQSDVSGHALPAEPAAVIARISRCACGHSLCCCGSVTRARYRLRRTEIESFFDATVEV